MEEVGLAVVGFRGEWIREVERGIRIVGKRRSWDIQSSSTVEMEDSAGRRVDEGEVEIDRGRGVVRAVREREREARAIVGRDGKTCNGQVGEGKFGMNTALLERGETGVAGGEERGENKEVARACDGNFIRQGLKFRRGGREAGRNSRMRWDGGESPFVWGISEMEEDRKSGNREGSEWKVSGSGRGLWRRRSCSWWFMEESGR